MEQAIKLVIARAKDPNLAQRALTCLQAYRTNSPVAQVRYQQLLQAALYQDGWTPEERAILAEPLEAIGSGSRSELLRVRMTAAEKAGLEQEAAQAGQSVSEYVRRKLFEDTAA